MPLLLLIAWINGPSVSPDQAYVRGGLILAVIAFNVGLFVARWRRRRSHPRMEDRIVSQRPDDVAAGSLSGDCHDTRKSRGSKRIAIAFILAHSLLVGWCACRNSFSWTETGLLPAGIIDWRYASFDVFRVNPPLVRMWAAMPVLAFDPQIPFRGVSVDPRSRAEWDVARAMIEANGEITWLWLTVARLWCLPFVWAGMWVAWRWSTELFGRCAGIGCLLIWTFSPLMIGYGCLISGDAQAACMGLVTLYVFRKWVRDVRLETSYILGVVAGMTVLTKTSWMALFGLLPLLWVLIRTFEFVGAWGKGNRPGLAIRAMIRETGLAVASMVMCLVVINLAYGFDGSFGRLDSFEFISKALTHDPNWRTHNYHGNRFADSWMGVLPVPLPEDMVIGMDLQKWDFDRPRSSYFRGEWRDYGWWYYYLYALAIKGPLGTWSLLLLAAIGAVRWSAWRASWRDHLILLLPMMLVLGAASAETGLNRHVRYVLPIIPLAFVLISRTFVVFEPSSEQGDKAGRGHGEALLRHLVAACASWLVLSSLWIYPHSHSYFNELIGGPLNASPHMNASNLDWGQDLKFVKEWCERHPDRRPVFTKAYLHLIDHQKMGIENKGFVPPMLPRSFGVQQGDKIQFPTGWYLVDHETMLRELGDYQYLYDLCRSNPTHYEHIGYGFVAFQVGEDLAAEFQAMQDVK